MERNGGINMFTGLVEEIGRVILISKQGKSMKIKIEASKLLEGAKVGDSIATNGVCLTAVEVGNGYFVADAMPETYERSNLKRVSQGSKVNLEKSITLSTPLGGHLVTGDVDCEGKIVSKKDDGIAIVYEIEMEEKYMKYIVEKGRVTIDGASLTVISFADKSFKVSIIPHTQDNITLGAKGQGDIVNIETDLVGKYIERFLSSYLGNNQYVDKSKLDLKFLIDNGFA